MNIYFCEVCGRRVSDQEIEEGEGFNAGMEGVFCKACYKKTPPKGTTSSSQRPKSSGTNLRVPSGSKLPMPASTPAPKMVAASTTRMPAATTTRTPSSKLSGRQHAEKSSSTGIVIGAVVLVLCIGGGYVAFGGKTEAPKVVSKDKPDGKKQPEQPKTPDQKPPEQKTPEVKPNENKTENKPAPTPAVEPAERDFDALTAQVAGLKDDAPARIKAAEEFIAKYPEHILASRARRIIDDAKKPAVQPPPPPVATPAGTVAAMLADTSALPSAAHYADRGYRKILAGELDGGMKDVNKALEIDSNPWNYHAIRAVGCYATGSMDEYKKEFDLAKKGPMDTKQLDDKIRREGEQAKFGASGKALEGKLPGTALEYHARGMYRRTLERLDDAMGDFNEALKLDQSLGASKGIFYYLSQIHEKKKDFKNKVDYLRRWADALPPTSDSQNAYAWELLTCQDEKLRDVKAALPYATKAAELSQFNDPHKLDTYAYALFKNGKTTEAIEQQEKAVKLLPASAPDSLRLELEMRLNEMKAAK